MVSLFQANSGQASAHQLSARQQVRTGLWLLAAQLLVIVPLYRVLPVWTLLLWAGIASWYWQVLRRAWLQPSALIKTALVILGYTGIYFQYGSFMAIEPMVACLVVAVVLKLLELRSQRDYWLMILLCYFILACGFLFEQGIAALLIAIAQLLVLLAAQQNVYGGGLSSRRSLWLGATMLAQSLPLMLFLFVVFPRFGPLWTMPLPSQQGRTGMSDSLEFGDISRLMTSAELAFRVSFEGQSPVPGDLYWRGLVLEHLDGRRWQRVQQNPRTGEEGPRPLVASAQAQTLSYTITMESGYHQWLYSLSPSRLHSAGAGQEALRYGGAGQWLLRKPRLGRLQYQGWWQRGGQIPSGSEQELAVNRRLPSSGNPRTRALAETWRRQYPEPADRLQAAMAFFRAGGFIYTLQPPRLGKNNVDEFLFDSRQGFCEHFAASLVYAMRAAGLPARLVVGYQGGEPNLQQGYLMVYQSDAHAWAEVWLAGQGWVRVDPTATVSPDRIRLGAGSVLADQLGFLDDSLLSLRRYAWAKSLRLWVDELNYAWARWVVNFDSDSQTAVLVKLLGRVDMQRLLIALLLFGALPLALLGLWAMRFQFKPTLEPADRYYVQACERLAKKTALPRRPGETPRQYCQRISELYPEWGGWLSKVTEHYSRCQYRGASEQGEELAALKSLRQPVQNFRR